MTIGIYHYLSADNLHTLFKLKLNGKCKVAKSGLFTESCGMYLFVYEVSLRDRSYNRLRHRAFHGEAVPGDEKLNAKIPQLFVMNLKVYY